MLLDDGVDRAGAGEAEVHLLRLLEFVPGRGVGEGRGVGRTRLARNAQESLQGAQPLIQARRLHLRGQRPVPQRAPRIHDESQPPVRRARRRQVRLNVFT